MVTPAQVRKLVSALPESEEKSHFGNPDFRVRNKIFAGLDADGTRGSLKLTPEIQSGVLSARPDAFYPAAGAWGRSGWTHFKLAELELGALSDLLLEAWRLVAPKRLSNGSRPRSEALDAAHSGGPREKAEAKPTRSVRSGTPKARATPKARRAAPKPAKRKALRTRGRT